MTEMSHMSDQPDTYGAWVVYAYDHGPYAIALYAGPEGAAHHQARQGYGSVGFWRYGTELADAVKQWEGRSEPDLPDPPKTTCSCDHSRAMHAFEATRCAFIGCGCQRYDGAMPEDGDR